LKLPHEDPKQLVGYQHCRKLNATLQETLMVGESDQEEGAMSGSTPDGIKESNLASAEKDESRMISSSNGANQMPLKAVG